ncbi:hypothetical protein GC093_16135 [Paenibacillus sp. LMG 31456]|uniref:Spore coat protein n=1 Tax=Paenibacillus foliorum TaxID=2654974 RepID=A0A972GQ37_9BACL|nr:hypothetical protein [Paenibacillus foliorum]NOU94737.1 hypothetical protein [Paenibacillus foliorum]
MKAMQWLSKLIISAIITSMICVASTFWVVNTYVDMILEQYHLKSAVSTTPDWSKFMQHASKQLGAFRLFGNEAGAVDPSGRSAKQKGEETMPVFEQPANGLNGLDMTNSGENGKSSSQQPSSTGSTSQRKPPEDAVAVFGQQNGITEGSSSEAGSASGGAAGSASSTGSIKKDTRTSAEISGAAKRENGGNTAGSSSTGGQVAGIGSDTAEKVVVSGEEFTKKKEQLSTNDKTKIFNLLVKRVPQNEMQHISKLMEDGITGSELKEIERVLQAYMKPEEYSQLLSLIKQE